MRAGEPNPTQHGHPALLTQGLSELTQSTPTRPLTSLRSWGPRKQLPKAACLEPAPTALVPHFRSRAPCDPTLREHGPCHPAAGPRAPAGGQGAGQSMSECLRARAGLQGAQPRAATPRGRFKLAMWAFHVGKSLVSRAPSHSRTHVPEPGPRCLAASRPEAVAQEGMENGAVCVDSTKSQSLLGASSPPRPQRPAPSASSPHHSGPECLTPLATRPVPSPSGLTGQGGRLPPACGSCRHTATFRVTSPSSSTKSWAFLTE